MCGPVLRAMENAVLIVTALQLRSSFRGIYVFRPRDREPSLRPDKRISARRADLKDANKGLVFIIDNDADVRASTRTLLSAVGYAVVEFATPSQFLSATHAAKPGCIVADQELPGMDGVALTELLRARGDETPMILVAGNGKQLASRAGRAGATAVLRKPLAADALTHWLEQVFS